MSEQRQETQGHEVATFMPVHESALSMLFAGCNDAAEVHNFDLRNEEDQLAYISAGAGESFPLVDQAGKEIGVVAYHARPVQYVQQTTGELVAGVRCVLLTEDGLFLSTCSPSAIRTIGLIANTRPRGQRWNPPIRLSVKKQRTSNGHNCLILTPVFDHQKVVNGQAKQAK